jgi:N-succinyl-L-ornithine transcarbamylase
MRKFTSVEDVRNIPELVDSAFRMKAAPHAYMDSGRNKTLALLFFNPSLRTRLSTQLAAQNLGMNVVSMDAAAGWQLEFEEGVVMNGDKAEHIKEAAAVVSQYADIIGIRSFPTLTDRQKDYEDCVLNKFVQYARVPVVSLESAILHPLQSLADLVTIQEFKTVPRPKVVLTWAPHPRSLPQAVANSFCEWMNAADVDFTIAQPEGCELHPRFIGNAKVEYNQARALENADFVYAKNWSSYKFYGQNVVKNLDWTVTAEKMARTNNAKFMHCLPVRRNIVVTDEVLDGPQSIVIEQANNRTFAAQAVLKAMLDAL